MPEQIITHEITGEEDRINFSTKLINLKTFLNDEI